MSDGDCEYSGHTWDYRSAVEVDEIPCTDCDAVKSLVSDEPAPDPHRDNCEWCGDETDFCGHAPYYGSGYPPKRNPTPWNSHLIRADLERKQKKEKIPLKTTSLDIKLVAMTQLVDPEAFSDLWRPEPGVSGAESLIEAASRGCYQSWKRPNPATASNAGYLKHILEVGHYSVLEHGVVSFLVRGVSRPLSLEMARHRFTSRSELSQRFVDGSQTPKVLPPLVRDALESAGEAVFLGAINEAFETAMDAADEAYATLVPLLTVHLDNTEPELTKTARRKKAREAARAVLPNATATEMVITANFRAWMGIITKRDDPSADAEIIEFAQEIGRQLAVVAPNIFGEEPRKLWADAREI